ncbi:MAG: IS30 family transposase, partial [Selenomonas bovis]|nr:IS30 family transposase [Selenomonas bovis]
MGRSIEERDPSIEERQEFGHWECDLVLGARSKDEVLLTLVERKTRRAILRKLRNKESTTVLEAFRKLRQEAMFKDCFDQVFRTLTTDNGSEFARLSELEETNAVRVYYAHPYCSCEKGTNENHNGLFRRFLPKGKRMEDYPAGHIARVEEWANTLPRKILGYSAPEECFEK